MSSGPKGEKRAADVNARAVMIAKIATGELADTDTEDGKNAAAVALGRMGGRRDAGMSPQEAERDCEEGCRRALEGLASKLFISA